MEQNPTEAELIAEIEQLKTDLAVSKTYNSILEADLKKMPSVTRYFFKVADWMLTLIMCLLILTGSITLAGFWWALAQKAFAFGERLL